MEGGRDRQGEAAQAEVTSIMSTGKGPMVFATLPAAEPRLVATAATRE